MIVAYRVRGAVAENPVGMVGLDYEGLMLAGCLKA